MLEIEPSSGDRSVVSGGGAGSGSALTTPVGLAEEASGAVVVSNASPAMILRVDLASGDRSVVSSSSVGSGPGGDVFGDVLVEASGSLLVVDAGAGSSLLRVDPTTGDRSQVADVAPTALAREPAGDVVLAIGAALMRLAATDALATLSDANVGSGPLFGPLADVAVAPGGSILAIDPGGAGNGALYRVDPSSGDRTIVSGNATGAGPALIEPISVVALSDDAAVVGDEGTGAAVWIDLATGNRTWISFLADDRNPRAAARARASTFRGPALVRRARPGW